MKKQLLLCAILLTISTGAFAMIRKVEDKEPSGNPSTEQRVSSFDPLAQQANGDAAPEKKETLKKRLKTTKDGKEGSLNPSVKNDDEKAIEDGTLGSPVEREKSGSWRESGKDTLLTIKNALLVVMGGKDGTLAEKVVPLVYSSSIPFLYSSSESEDENDKASEEIKKMQKDSGKSILFL